MLEADSGCGEDSRDRSEEGEQASAYGVHRFGSFEGRRLEPWFRCEGRGRIAPVTSEKIATPSEAEAASAGVDDRFLNELV
ncbi:hypothetical protein, partial [Streptomyces hundungensis]|uniref:hypothetical protein n=1 Tax=Streptomyces hundungensis TaxID=1077946 RepID=UPI0033D37F23